jgi:hypothetical protein
MLILLRLQISRSRSRPSLYLGKLTWELESARETIARTSGSSFTPITDTRFSMISGTRDSSAPGRMVGVGTVKQSQGVLAPRLPVGR